MLSYFPVGLRGRALVGHSRELGLLESGNLFLASIMRWSPPALVMSLRVMTWRKSLQRFRISMSLWVPLSVVKTSIKNLPLWRDLGGIHFWGNKSVGSDVMWKPIRNATSRCLSSCIWMGLDSWKRFLCRRAIEGMLNRYGSGYLSCLYCAGDPKTVEVYRYLSLHIYSEGRGHPGAQVQR